MFRRFFGIACFTGLLTAIPAFAQPSQQVEGLLEKGTAKLDKLPEVPSDFDKEYYYKFEAKEKPIGWQHIKLDTVSKDGENYYRYRARYGLNGIEVGYANGEEMVIMDRKWKPLEIRNRMESITAQGGKRDIEDRARIKHDKFQRRYFDGRQTKKFKFEYGDINAVYLPEPLFGQLSFEPGERFAFTSYDIQRGTFDTIVYEVGEKKKEGMTKLRTWLISSVEDPSKLDNIDFVMQEDPNRVEEKKEDEETEEEREKKQNYILIDDDKSIRFINLPRVGITVRRVDAERVDEVKKELEIHESDIHPT